MKNRFTECAHMLALALFAAAAMGLSGCYYVEHVHHDYYDDYDYHHLRLSSPSLLDSWSLKRPPPGGRIVRQSPKLKTSLLVLMLAAAGITLLSGCHFHRYHHEYFEYDEYEDHPHYGSHHN